MRTSFQFVVLTVAGCLTGCGATGNSRPSPGAGGDPSVGGAADVGGTTSAEGGSLSAVGGASTRETGGSMAATGGSIPGAGGATGGSPQTSGTKSTAGGAAPTTGGSNATGGKAAGGAFATGGKAAGGVSATGGKAAGGATAAGGAAAGAAATGGDAAGGGPDCSATMPTGGKTYSGTSVNGTADGLNYGIWATGTGGDITVFTDAHAFSAAWTTGTTDFLAHVGLDFNPPKAYTTYGTIAAQFVEVKTGTAGNWSAIGIYGWTHSPCVEWYINEDSFNGLYGAGSVTATIDGAVYSMTTSTTTGTGGANACEAGHTGSWTNMTSTRKTARQCGTVTVSDHFAAWEKQGWILGTLASVHINVEVGGGTGGIQFPVANVTTTSK